VGPLDRPPPGRCGAQRVRPPVQRVGNCDNRRWRVRYTGLSGRPVAARPDGSLPSEVWLAPVSPDSSDHPVRQPLAGRGSLWGDPGCTGDHVQVVDTGAAAKVEQVVALVHVAARRSCQWPIWAGVCSTAVVRAAWHRREPRVAPLRAAAGQPIAWNDAGTCWYSSGDQPHG
jgi:hypothetical protein